MENFEQVFNANPSPCFMFNITGEIKLINDRAKLFLNDWNESEKMLTEKNLKILLYQNNLSLQNIEILSQNKYFRFEVVKVSDDEFCFYGSNVTFQKNTADTLFNLIDDVHEALFLVDTDNNGHFVEVNRTATKYLGYDREEFLTMKLIDIVEDFPLLSQEEWDEHRRSVKQKDGSVTKTAKFVRKDGTTFAVEMVVSIKSIMEKDYQLTLVRDITERLEEESAQEEMKIKMFSTAKLSHLGEMATSIAHEINNPLTVIVAKTLNLKKMLSTTELDKGKALASLEMVESTIKRITTVIGSLRNISKSLEDDSFCNEVVQDIFSDVINLYYERLKFQTIELEVVGESVLKELIVYCNRSQVAQVLISLLNNSFEAIPKLQKKWIKVMISEENGELCISIIDSGKGIQPVIVDKMFEPFYSTKQLGNGKGLGLAISKSILLKHGGRLDYDRTSKNTCFKVVLPVTKTSV